MILAPCDFERNEKPSTADKHEAEDFSSLRSLEMTLLFINE